MNWKAGVVIATLGGLAGCGHMVPQIEKAELSGFPASDIQNFKVAADLAAKKYRKEFIEQEDREWDTGEANLIGGALGAIGAVAQSVPIAGVGALTAGTSAMTSSFYGVEKQNDAFTKAFGATRCLATLSTVLNSPTAMNVIGFPTDNDDASSYSLELLNSAMFKVEDRLVERLRKRAVSTATDFSLFEQSMRASLRSTPASIKDDAKSMLGDTNNAVLAAEVEKVRHAVGRLEADIGLCLSAN